MKIKSSSVESTLFFRNNLPLELDKKNCILIYDRVLEKNFSLWIKKFSLRYPVKAGEDLKQLHCFFDHVEKLHRLATGIGKKDLTIVAVGGGSVGDFAGFFASIYRRGSRLVMIPSTWLAAIDSAHGGKTALNLGQAKNQVGSFYLPEKIYLCQNLLRSQYNNDFSEELNSIVSEATKVALLKNKNLFQKVCKAKTPQQLFQILPLLIKAKYEIVQKDPQEKNGYRHLLNFGHTIGHILEGELQISHAKAVSLGLRFAIDWSKNLGILSVSNLESDVPGVANARELQVQLRRLRNAKNILITDKKLITKNRIRFIFLKKPGQPLIREVTPLQIQLEMQRQMQRSRI